MTEDDDGRRWELIVKGVEAAAAALTPTWGTVV
jgi:hypothetical protein